MYGLSDGHLRAGDISLFYSVADYAARVSNCVGDRLTPPTFGKHSFKGESVV